MQRLDRLQDNRAASALWDVGHFIVFAVRRFFAERMNNAAASLTYSTLLALVPLLVIAFAILSSFSAFDAVKGRMQQLFFEAVVPEAGAAISDYLSNFTQNASNLTAVGVVALAVAAVLLLSTVEDTLNRVWHVERPRPLMVRFLIFWAVLTLGPLLIGVSITLTSDLMKYASEAQLTTLGIQADVSEDGWRVLDGLLSVLISIVGFTALFVLVPARRVKIKHALIGGTFAAVSFEVLAWGFNTFLTSGSSYETIYGAVAAVPVFLVWVYTSWMVIILGAVFAASFPDWWQARSGVLDIDVGPSEKLKIAVALLARLHRHARAGGTLDEEDLVSAAPLGARDDILDSLVAAGYVVQAEDGKVALARDMHRTRLSDLATDLELSLGIPKGQDSVLPNSVERRLGAEGDAVDRLLQQLHEVETRTLGMPLAELMGDEDDAPTPVEIMPRAGTS
ncbi:YihY family inner membrane protein [Thalassococcus sp. BH17M4-6]|uniref:YihY family inner membrane protein n=1 Tax=Thalassococcus sp. BH17M4-6 TaxID=3413148 RepID=UPI003BBECB14